MNNSSKTSGGQVPVRSTTEGIRDGGGNNGRGPVSPLGGVSNSTPGDQSQKEERSERPQGPMPKPI